MPVENVYKLRYQFVNCSLSHYIPSFPLNTKPISIYDIHISNTYILRESMILLLQPNQYDKRKE